MRTTALGPILIRVGFDGGITARGIAAASFYCVGGQCGFTAAVSIYLCRMGRPGSLMAGSYVDPSDALSCGGDSRLCADIARAAGE